ncbi:hypothetical protein BDP55DRAFT_369320 [Colletotrichum godetiae]|uniref:Uncharacterized protein n=1 Tax=Colletotrichum godetiae TaxID=1209918 RepID=A0AAJ0EMR8_9PEZI|nr:uncharacterized protein BDP55DRAFT_369320 [Colletotrichum godetiae]KAK1658980.1 hypothetical protein BDP55DRAFT_369320 [Colletotrichum godetiae]
MGDRGGRGAGSEYNFKVPAEEKHQLWHLGGPDAVLCLYDLYHLLQETREPCAEVCSRAQRTITLFTNRSRAISSCLIIPHRAIRNYIWVRSGLSRSVSDSLGRQVGRSKLRKSSMLFCLFLTTLPSYVRQFFFSYVACVAPVARVTSLTSHSHRHRASFTFCCLRGSQIRTDWSRAALVSHRHGPRQKRLLPPPKVPNRPKGPQRSQEIFRPR